jgi:hypothetical protein
MTELRPETPTSPVHPTWFDSPWFVWSLGLLVSALFTRAHVQHATEYLTLRYFVNFQGEQPFQSRVLPFLLARRVSLFHHLDDKGLVNLFMLMDYIATVLCFVLVWHSARVLLKRPRSLVWVLALFWWQMFGTFVVSQVHNYYYPYDMMSLAFVAGAVYLIVSGASWRALLVICVPAMFNRETAVLIPFFYLAYHWPAGKLVWRNAAAMLLTCAAMKLLITFRLHAFGGMVSLYHEPGYLRLFYNFSFLSMDARLVHTANVFLAWGGAWCLLLLPGQSAPALHRMMWCLLPYFMGMMVVGNLSEIRIFAEFIPLMTLLLAGKLGGEYGRHESA